MKDGKGTSKERTRAWKWKRLLKARRSVQKDPPTCCSAELIRIMKDGNDIREDPPSPRASKLKGISKKRPRASKRKRVLKAPKVLQNGPPTSCAAKTTMEQDYDCSHPSSSYGYCDVCEEYLPVYYGPPDDISEMEDAWYRRRP